MKTYNEQYYFIFNNYNNTPSYLTPFRNTHERRWSYKKLSISGGPVYFENGFKEKYQNVGKKHPINDVMAISGYFLVHKRIQEKMQLLQIDNMQFFPAVFPAVFVDDDDD